MNPVLKKNFAVFPVLDWIATLTTHIPNKGEQLIRYYGYYSNVSRGKRKKEKPEDKTEITEIDAPPVFKKLKKRPTSFEKFMKQTRLFVSITGTWGNVHRSLLLSLVAFCLTPREQVPHFRNDPQRGLIIGHALNIRVAIVKPLAKTIESGAGAVWRQGNIG